MNDFAEQILCEERRLQSLIDLTAPFESASPEGVLLLQKHGATHIATCANSARIKSRTRPIWGRWTRRRRGILRGVGSLRRNGERVRSKGESLYANMLLEAGIPFLYDSVFTITDDYGNQKTVSPDFHIKCLDRSHLIIEHLGRLFEKGYSINFGEKCYWYLQAG